MSIYGAKRIADNIDVLLDELKIEMTNYTSNQIEAARNTIHDWTITFINTEKNIMDTKVNTLENSLRNKIEGGDKTSRDQAIAMFTTAREEAAVLENVLREEDTAVKRELNENIADHKTILDNSLIQITDGFNTVFNDFRTDMAVVHENIRTDMSVVHENIRTDLVAGDEVVKTGLLETISEEKQDTLLTAITEIARTEGLLATDLSNSVDLLYKEILRADDEVRTEVYANADVVYTAIRNEMSGVGVGGAFLPTAGGSMSGNIDMSDNKIINLPHARNRGEPISYEQYAADIYKADRIHAIEAVLPGIPLPDDIILGIIPTAKSVLYSNNGEINTVMDIYNTIPFAAGNQPPRLAYDHYNQPYLWFNGEIGCDLIASNINGASLGGPNSNTSTIFFICKNRMRQTSTAFFWGAGNKRLSMHIQNTNKISIDYGKYPEGRLEVNDLDPPLESILEAWAYVYDGATASLFRSDFHMPPDKSENFVSIIDDINESFHIGSIPNVETYRGDMDFYGMLIYSKAFEPNQLTTMFQYLTGRIRGIGIY